MTSVPTQAGRFRRPEFSFYGRASNFEHYQKTGEFLLRSYWPGFQIDDIQDWGSHFADNAAWRLFFNSLGWLSVLAGTDVDGREHPSDWPLCKNIVMRFVGFAEGQLNAKSADVWHDHAMAYRVSYLSYLYETGLAAHLDADEDLRLRRMMEFQTDEIKGFMRRESPPLNNHTIFHSEAIADASLVFSEQPENDIALCQHTLERLLDTVVDRSTGITNEQAAFYHVFLIGRLMDTRAFFGERGVSLPGYDDELFSRMVAFQEQIEPRPGILPAYGDSKHEQPYSDEFLARAKLIHRPRGAASDTVESGRPVLVAYPKDGYFIFRAGPPDRELYGLFLHRPERGVHGHWDGGSFISYSGGECALADGGGPYLYKRPLRFLYFQSQLAHNTVIFNDEPVELKTSYIGHSSSENGQHGAVVTSARMSRFGGWYRAFGQWGDKLQYTIDIPLSQRPRTETARVRFHPAPERHVGTVDHDGVDLRSDAKSPVEMRFREEAIPAERARDLLHAVLVDTEAPASTRHKHVSPLERLEERSLVTRADGEFCEGVLIARPLEFATMNVTTIRFVPGVDLEVKLEGNMLHLRPTWNGESHASDSISIRMPELQAPGSTKSVTTNLRARARSIWRKFRVR